MQVRDSDFLAWLDAVLSATMLSSVFWMHALDGLSIVLHFVVLFCGAIIGIHSVRRIWRGQEPAKDQGNEE